MANILRTKDSQGVWHEILSIVGPQGPQGPQGPAGPGTGDMLASVYDPAEGRRQVAFANELHSHSNKSLLDSITQTLVNTWNTVTGKYEKPSGGIPSTDMTTAVQTSLGKADTALQEHQSLSAYRTASAQDAIDNTKITNPSGGVAGNVLKKTASGEEWGTVNEAEWGTVNEAEWGNITGTLSNQTDLQTALDAKGTYSKPSGGIPSTDMTTAVQTSLAKASLAVVCHTEDTEPIASIGDLWTVAVSYPGLCFTAEEAGSTVCLSPGSSLNGYFYYSTDKAGRFWDVYESYAIITLSNVGDKVYFKGNHPTLVYRVGQFNLTGRIAASGNIMSLLDETCQSLAVSHPTFSTYGAFDGMFSSQTALTSAPNLPAETLSSGCYQNMFYGCTSLTIAPSLPATVLQSACYNSMFQNCSGLVSAPKLPATSLADACYSYMFEGCSSLAVYSTSGEGHVNAWRIPTEGAVTEYSDVSHMFIGTIGDYSASETVNLNSVFYTQNAPI